MITVGSWLTAARLQRLPLILTSIRSGGRAGLPRLRAEHILWPACGGAFDDLPRLVEVLVGARLAEVRDGRLRLTGSGHRVATQDHQQNGRILAKALLHSGYLAEQVRILLERSSRSPDGRTLRCSRREARRGAPQVLLLLRRWPDVTFGHEFSIPIELAAEVLNFWAVAQPAQGAGAVKDEIGLRGELYSFQYERERASDATKVNWVAREDDSLGYDLLDLNLRPKRLIEVKGSGSETLRFYLSENELRVAEMNPATYEVQFWGGIDPQRPRPEDYNTLREQGFPEIIRDVFSAIREGRLVSRTASLLVTRPSDEP